MNVTELFLRKVTDVFKIWIALFRTDTKIQKNHIFSDREKKLH